MRFFFLAFILLLSSRVAHSGPLNFGDSTLSEPDEFSLVDDDGNTGVDNDGNVMELRSDLSQSNQFDAFSTQEANILPDPQIIPGIANDGSANLLAALPAAAQACSDSDSRGKSSGQTNDGNLCPTKLETPPSGQSPEEDRPQQDRPGSNAKPNEKKEDGPISNPTTPDDICAPRKKLYCCFGREIENWNSRENCEECMLPPFLFFTFHSKRPPAHE